MDVVVVGSCMTDLNSYASRLPKVGETLFGDKFSIGCGGKGANQCIVASRLGAKTAMIGKVGSDSFGNDHVQNFKDNGINIDHVSQTEKAKTGVAAITINKEGLNSIIIIPGANMILDVEDVKRAESVIQTCKVVCCQLENAPEVTLSALKLAKKHGVTTILNPTPAPEILDPELYGVSDIFCINELEAEMFINQPVNSVDDAKRATDVLLDRGCKTVIITLGEQGCVYASRECREPVHVTVSKVTPVDTTGAGDAFVGSLAYFLAFHPLLPFHEIVKRAGEIAAVTVQAAGTQTSYPLRHELPQNLFQ